MPADHRRWWATVRVRVTAVASLGVLGVLVAVGALLLVEQRRGLVAQLDDTLGVEAARLAGDLASGAGAPPASGDDRFVVVAPPDGERVVVAGEDDDTDEDDDAGSVAAVVDVEADDERTVTIDGERWRVVSAEFDTAGGTGTVHVGAPLEDVDESVAELRQSLLWIVPAATVLLGALVWFVAGRTLRPVEQIRAEVASIGPAELNRRVPVPAGGDEIARLATTMNAMLDRLEDSAKRQQRFVADASHELRTPLTRMRAELEVDERDPARADAAATRLSQLQEIAALQRLIDDLLLLARGDETAAAPRQVDLDDVVLDEVRHARATSPVELDASGVSAAQVVGDADQLRRVVRNLIDNATRHATSKVVVQLAERDGAAELVVADDGPGIAPQHRTEIFERFTRLDAARAGGAGRAGLGLAIVRDIVARHGGSITVDDAPGGGARFTARLGNARSHRQ